MSRRLVDGQMPKPGPGAKKAGRALVEGSLLESDPKLIDKICNAIKMGSYPEAAAAINNVGYSTLRSWVLKGKEHPASLYGAFNRALEKALAEAEVIDISIIHQNAHGRPAQYEYVAIRDKKGNVILDDNKKPMMEIARDPDGRPILKSSEIKPDWKAAAWKLERRNPKRWRASDQEQLPSVLDINAEEQKPQERDAITPEQRQAKIKEFRELANNLKELDDDEFSK